jgi:hypothetical protein
MFVSMYVSLRMSSVSRERQSAAFSPRISISVGLCIPALLHTYLR